MGTCMIKICELCSCNRISQEWVITDVGILAAIPAINRTLTINDSVWACINVYVYQGLVCQYVMCFVLIAILNYIKSRRLDTLFEFEEKVMSKAANLDRSIMELLADSDAGTPEDKMRLFLIFYICSHSMSKVWTVCFIIIMIYNMQ
jgi:hypothetical protein